MAGSHHAVILSNPTRLRQPIVVCEIAIAGSRWPYRLSFRPRDEYFDRLLRPM